MNFRRYYIQFPVQCDLMTQEAIKIPNPTPGLIRIELH